jgi:hypothetical protein
MNGQSLPAMVDGLVDAAETSMGRTKTVRRQGLADPMAGAAENLQRRLEVAVGVVELAKIVVGLPEGGGTLIGD